MIKLSIKGEIDSPENIKRGVLYLKQYGDDISLCVEDPLGRYENFWILLRIHSDGTFSRKGGLSKDLGFQLDEADRVKERE